jgi:DNA repair exonuclease SbcCD nuclease subunit
MASQKNIPFYFIDGNHEDHHQLRHETTLEVTELEPGLFWIPRGTTFELGETRLLGIGGAVSVDRAWRTEHVDWFHEEVATFEQFHRALTATDIDIVVAHDVPTGVSLDLTFPVTAAIEAHCVSHRDGMAELRDTLEPEWWIAGHYHQRVTDHIGDTTVEVLAHDAIRLEDSTMEYDV